MVSDDAAKPAGLIDADNAQPVINEALSAEIAKYGTAHVKRAYGDWTGTGPQRLEGPFAHPLHPADPAIRLEDARKVVAPSQRVPATL